MHSLLARLVAVFAVLAAACGGWAWAQADAPPPPGDPAAGEVQFRRQCAACHIATATGPGRLGPTLFGVVGRAAGTVPGYRYSQANRTSTLTWTPEVLYRYLRNPREVVAGTTMAFAGVRNDQERADIIAYLATLHP